VLLRATQKASFQTKLFPQKLTLSMLWITEWTHADGSFRHRLNPRTFCK